MNHVKGVGGELVVARGDTAKVLQPGEEALDQVALSMELLAEAWLPAPVTFGGILGAFEVGQVTSAHTDPESEFGAIWKPPVGK